MFNKICMENKLDKIRNPLLKYVCEYLKTNEILNLASVSKRFRKLLNFTKVLSKILKYIEESKNKRIYEIVTELNKVKKKLRLQKAKNEEFAKAIVLQTRFLYYSQEDLITFPLQDKEKLKNLEFYEYICKDLEETNEKNRLIFVKLSNEVLDRIFNENDKYFEKIPKIINGIDLYGEPVSLHSLEVLFKGLMKWENNIIKLDLDSCKIGDDASHLIADFLKYSKKLSILLLRKNSITNIGIKYISEGVLEDSSLIDFDIAFNKLGNEGCAYISDVLNKAKKLKKLFISGNNISFEGIQALFDSIQKHTNLYYISLINNNINDNNTLKLLFDAVIESKVIQKLNIGYNKFDNNQAEIISDFVSKDVKLKKLFLFQFNLNTKDSVTKLSKALEKNKTIEYLNLKDSKFDRSFKHFPNFLPTNKSILRLNLYNNILDDKDINILTKCMFKNNTLEVLNLGQNYISENGAINLASLIESNQSLKDLDLSSNKLGSEGAEYIFKALKKNKTLLFLNLKNNNIYGKSIDKLLKTLKNYNHSIEYINLKRNEINLEMGELEEIRKILEKNKKIKYIGLNYDENKTPGFEKLFLKNVLRDNLLKNKYDLD